MGMEKVTKDSDEILQSKLVAVEQRLKETMTNEIGKNKQNIEAVIKENTTYAEATSGNLHIGRAEKTNAMEFKSILHEARNDQLIEDQEREKRCKFFIIHGLVEKVTNTEEINNNDVALVDLFFQQLNIVARPTKFYRLGKSDSNRNRPLKLEMMSTIDRDAAMRNLNYLKDSEEKLGKLSVKEDLTQSERQQVRNKVETSHRWVRQ